jgi:hypothetical protein
LTNAHQSGKTLSETLFSNFWTRTASWEPWFGYPCPRTTLLPDGYYDRCWNSTRRNNYKSSCYNVRGGFSPNTIQCIVRGTRTTTKPMFLWSRSKESP